MQHAEALDTTSFWLSQLDGDDPDLGARRVQAGRDRAPDLLVRAAVSDTDIAGRLLRSGLPMFELVVAAAARTLTRWRQSRAQPTPPPLLALETHGRVDAVVDSTGDDMIDTTDTVGLLSAIYPLRMHYTDPHRVAEQLGAILGAGIDYGLLRYLRADTARRLSGLSGPQLLLNYVGRTDLGLVAQAGAGLRLDRELLGGLPPLSEPDLAVRHELTVMATLLGARDQQILLTQWRALPEILNDSDLTAMQALWDEALQETLT